MVNRDYTGILAEPMPRRGDDARPTSEEKLVALFQHYEIEPPSSLLGKPTVLFDDKPFLAWQKLALALAFQHVPAFRPRPEPAPPPPPRKRGRPATTALADKTLVFAVEFIRHACGLKLEQALQLMIKTDEVGVFPKKTSTLRTRYNRASGKSAGQSRNLLKSKTVKRAPYVGLSEHMSTFYKTMVERGASPSEIYAMTMELLTGNADSIE